MTFPASSRTRDGRRWPAAVLAAVLVLAATGCRSPDAALLRQAHAASYRDQLKQETAEILARLGPELSLAECLATTRERSLKLAAAELNLRLARLDRKAAFSVFLPQVTAGFNLSGMSEPAAKNFGGSTMEVQDQSWQEGSVKIAMPVFMPNAWLLYHSARRGEAISGLVRRRIGQMLELETAIGYYRVVAQEQGIAALEAETTYYERLEKDTAALQQAGYALATDVDKISTALAEARRKTNQARRAVTIGKARLLQTLNLWPEADIRLAPPEASVQPPPADLPVKSMEPGELLQIPLDEWLFQALLRRSEMAVTDQTVELRKNEIKRALALFLPELVGFTAFQATSDSYTVNPNYWVGGLQGTLSLFSGFRDLNLYRQAREKLAQSYLEREETAMMILMQVVEAYQNLKDLLDQHAIMVRADATAAAELAQVQARQAQGLVEMNRVLEARRTATATTAAKAQTETTVQAAFYVFRNVIGIEP